MRVTAGLAVFGSAFLIYLLTVNSVWATDHATSFLQLDWAIWTHHSFILGNGSSFQPNSVDDFIYKGNYYSALAPGTAILALPFVAIGFILDGHFTVFGYALLSSEVFIALVNSIAVYLVYALARLFFSKRTSVFLSFVYAFSTISWPFAVYFFQSDVSAMFDLLAVLFTIRVTRDGRGDNPRYALIAGISVAAALTTDYVNAILIPIIAGYLIFSFRRRPRILAKLSAAFLPYALVGVLLVGLYNEAIFGSAFHTTEQVYLSSSTPFGEFSTPLYQGIYLNLFSPLRGLFVYSIFLVLGLFGLERMLREKVHRAEAVLLLACFLGILLPYSAWYDPVGGAAFGPRFLVAAIPFLLIPAGLVIEEGSRRTRVVAFHLYAAGVIINGIAAVTEGIAPTTNWGLSPLLSFTLPNFLQGELDDWWLKFVGSSWPIPAVLIIVAALALPLVANRLLSKSEKETGGVRELPPASG
jgi:4-amino-4-deoxy-L-arabinose transferase-like glycosyltransferase